MTERRILTIAAILLAAISVSPAQTADENLSTTWDGPEGRPGSWFLNYNWTDGLPDIDTNTSITRDMAVIHSFDDVFSTASSNQLEIGGRYGATLEVDSAKLIVNEAINIGERDTETIPLPPVPLPWPPLVTLPTTPIPDPIPLSDIPTDGIITSRQCPGYLTLKNAELSCEIMVINSAQSYGLDINGELQAPNNVNQLNGRTEISEALYVGGRQYTILTRPSTSTESLTAIEAPAIWLDHRASYTLQDDAELDAQHVFVGAEGDGRILQLDGLLSCNSLNISGPNMLFELDIPATEMLNTYINRGGEYVMRAGSIDAQNINIATLGVGRFAQYGGSITAGQATIASRIATSSGVVFQYTPPRGCYGIAAGTADFDSLFIGLSGNGAMIQSGGHVNCNYMSLGDNYMDDISPNSTEDVYPYSASYIVSGGELEAATIFIGASDEAVFCQSGGSVDVDTIDIFSLNTEGKAAVIHRGGKLRANIINVGSQWSYVPSDTIWPNQLELAARVGLEIYEKLDFGIDSQLICHQNTDISMNGADLAIRNFDPETMADLDKCCFTFRPSLEADGSNEYQQLEAPSKDRGFTRFGYYQNFVINSLALKDGCQLKLVDNSNHEFWSDVPQAVYVRYLYVGPNSVLNLNGLNLYYLKGKIEGKVIKDYSGEVETERLSVSQMNLLAGDINLDGVVDLDDFILLKQNYGQSDNVNWACGDLNDDGSVDVNDFIILKQNYGSAE